MAGELIDTKREPVVVVILLNGDVVIMLPKYKLILTDLL